MGFLCNHQELIHCHLYYFLLEILLCVLYVYVSLFGGTLEVGWKALCRNKPSSNKMVGSGKGGGYVGTLYCIAV